VASDAGRLLAALRKPYTGTCVVCGKVFTKVGPKALYCSRHCQNQADYQKHRDKRIAAKKRPRQGASRDASEAR
jgi:predicted nucleic acid-binding Zn ribbon protein